MKKGSLVGIIIAAVIVVLGIVLCILGVSRAKADGQDLFSEAQSADGTAKTVLSDDVNKITLNLVGATVNISQSEDSSYVEYTNFNPNFYTSSTVAQIYSFNDSSQYTSITSLWENGFSFKGLRYLLDPRNFSTAGEKKALNIYLKPGNGINVIEITADSVSVNVDSAVISGDLVVKSKSASVRVSGSEISSMLSVETDASTVSLNDSKISHISLTCGSLTMDSLNLSSSDTKISAPSGDIVLSYTDETVFSSVSASSISGEILVNDASHGNKFEFASEGEGADAKLSVSTESANVKIYCKTGS